MRGDLGGGQPNLDEAAEDAARWGLILPEDWADRADNETGWPGIWDTHLPALTAFLAVSGQWRTSAQGMGGTRWIGLDYAAAKAGLDFAGIAMTPDIWADLRLIESGAIKELNKD